MIVHVAEDILPGRPDRLADAVAEALVDAAVTHDPDALVGVEVGVHRKAVFVTGRIAAAIDVPDLSISGIVRRFELATLRWVDVLRRGYFGSGHAWDEPAVAPSPSTGRLRPAATHSQPHQRLQVTSSP